MENFKAMAKKQHDMKLNKMCGGGRMAKGGTVEAEIKKAIGEHEKHDHPGKRKTKVKFAEGGGVEGKEPHERADKRARGGAKEGKSGGKGHTTNVIIAQPGGGGGPSGGPAGAPPPMAAPHPPIVPGPGGAPGMAGGPPPMRPPMPAGGPGGSPMPAGPGPGGPPMMPHKRGGEVMHRDMGGATNMQPGMMPPAQNPMQPPVQPGMPPQMRKRGGAVEETHGRAIHAESPGAGGGLGRLKKIENYGSGSR